MTPNVNVGTNLEFNALDELPALLTPEQISKVLRVGKNQAYALINSGQIEGFRVGRGIRVKRESLLKFVDSSKIK